MSNEGIFSKNFQGNKIIYSPYGYISINKEDYENPEKNIIHFSGITKDKSYQNPLFGTISIKSLQEKISAAAKNASRMVIREHNFFIVILNNLIFL